MSNLRPLVLNPPLNVTIVSDDAGLNKLQVFFENNKIFGWDKETNPVKDFYHRKSRLHQFGNQTEQYVVDLLKICKGDSELLSAAQGQYGKNLCPDLQRYINITKPVLCSNDWLKIGVNVGFEYMDEYWNFGLRPFHFYDCQMAERCIYAGLHSLKDYEFYSMESMMARYFHIQIDKELQTSFDLEKELTKEQYEYAALDTRTPLAIKGAQELVIKGETVKSRKSKNLGTVILERLNPLILGDNLEEIVQIENDAIGAFQDMHIHGENIDHEKWQHRINNRKKELQEVLEKLDKIFVPICGNKSEIITEAEVEKSKLKWKEYSKISLEEVELKGKIRKEKNLEAKTILETTLQRLANTRLEIKERLKKESSDLGKKRTKINKLVDKCEGQALLNYASNAQLLEVLTNIKGLEKLSNTDDTTLEKFVGNPVIDLVRVYREVAKDINTYGEQWITEWVTKPGKEEGWVSPYDHKLHSKFNQYDAETGRSSSDSPNGQNIPKDKETRSCFIAEEGHVLITIDMSGAELAILAEEAQELVWINAFKNKEDVHSICAHLVEPEKWSHLALPDCIYFEVKDGKIRRKKCKCPEHLDERDGMKSTNFGLPYGIGPRKLSGQIGKSYTETVEVLSKHRKAFPRLWLYLENSANRARIEKRSFDMFSRRRLFPDPTWELAKEKAREDRKEQLEFSPEIQKTNLDNFFKYHGRKPNSEEKWFLTHREPTSKEVGNAMQAMSWSIERQGKNHRIQSANASIIKLAMGAAYDKDNKPYLFHILPQYGAKLVKMVHDELVISVLEEHAETVAQLAKDSIARAASTKMKLVEMDSEYHIEKFWCK